MASSYIDFLDLLLSCDTFEGDFLKKNGKKILQYNCNFFYAILDNDGDCRKKVRVGYSDFRFGDESGGGSLYQIIDPESYRKVEVAYCDGNNIKDLKGNFIGYFDGYNIKDYRNRKKSSNKDDAGCFITTACTSSKSLPDNCAELTGLRKLRDNFLLKFPAGKKAVKKYYSVAPKIVEAIDRKENAKEVYDGLYQDLVLKSLELIEDGHMLQAFRNYQKVTSDLAKEYLPVRDPEMDKLFKPSLRRTRNSKGRKLVQKNENKDMSIAL